MSLFYADMRKNTFNKDSCYTECTRILDNTNLSLFLSEEHHGYVKLIALLMFYMALLRVGKKKDFPQG